MDIPEILKAGSNQLPLTDGMTLTDAIPLINTFYQTSWTADQFKATQAYVNTDNLYELDLIPTDSDEVVCTFVNKTTPVFDMDLGSPLASVVFESYLGDPIQLVSAVELDFLDDLPDGGSASTTSVTDLAYKLAQLLNSYQFLGNWHSGTLSPQTTGGFTRVYKGPSDGAPSNFKVDYSPMIAIVQMNYGKTKGYVCLTT